MHPILGEKKRITIYLIIWGAIGAMAGYILSSFNTHDLWFSLLFTVPLMLFTGELNLSSWFLCRAFPLERTHPWKLAVVAIFSLFFIGSIITLVSWGWLDILEKTISRTLSPIPLIHTLSIIFWISSQLFLISLALSYLLATFERSKESERNAYEARLHAQHAELRALRMQINPHFLFNSLNSINALVTTDAALARTMTTTLADFFRKSLSYGARDTIKLQEELSLLDHYLDIEMIRFGKRLSVLRQIDENTLHNQIPPLLLQPLVENAIKHGISNSIEGGVIAIYAQKKQDRLFITIENPLDDTGSEQQGAGMGLSIVKKRLEALYGNDGDIKTVMVGKVFRVVVFLPAKQ